MTEASAIAMPDLDGAELDANTSRLCSSCRTVLKTAMARQRGMCLRCVRARREATTAEPVKRCQRSGCGAKLQSSLAQARGLCEPCHKRTTAVDAGELLDLADLQCELCSGYGYTLTDSLDPVRIPCACTTRPGARHKPRPTGVRSIEDVEAFDALVEELPDMAAPAVPEHRWQREDVSDGPEDLITEPPRFSSPLSHVSSRNAMPAFFGRAPERTYEPIPDNIAELAEEQDRQQRAGGRDSQRVEPARPPAPETPAEPAKAERTKKPPRQEEQAMEGTAEKRTIRQRVQELLQAGATGVVADFVKQLEAQPEGMDGKGAPAVYAALTFLVEHRIAQTEGERPKVYRLASKDAKTPVRAKVRAKRVRIEVERDDTPAPFDPTKLTDEQLELVRVEHVKRHGEPAPVTVDRPWSDDQVREAFWGRGLFAVTDVENLDWSELEAAVAEIEQRCAAGDALRARVRKLAGQVR